MHWNELSKASDGCVVSVASARSVVGPAADARHDSCYPRRYGSPAHRTDCLRCSTRRSSARPTAARACNMMEISGVFPANFDDMLSNTD